MQPVAPPPGQVQGPGTPPVFSAEALASAVPAQVEMPAELAFDVSLLLLGDPAALFEVRAALDAAGVTPPSWEGTAADGARVIFHVVEQPEKPIPWGLCVSILPPAGEDGTFPQGQTWSSVPPALVAADSVMSAGGKVYSITARPAPSAPLEREARTKGGHAPGEGHAPGVYCPACSALPGLLELVPMEWLGGAHVYAGVRHPSGREIVLLKVRIGRPEEQLGLMRAWWARDMRPPMPDDPLQVLRSAYSVMAETTEAAGPYGARCAVLVQRNRICMYVGHAIDLVAPVSE